ncbi:hypothetical protein CEP52_009939 [Fusarium oligoseptatum]|uniref:Uncharacterized protein n=1 Tax=Fusarium oligoseptatum TaxID=2604345 RepID=A0A428TAJ8_9HYPO|nr:hypothetical protein CEP52_009939 [Fusarium oligoseptatum]
MRCNVLVLLALTNGLAQAASIGRQGDSVRVYGRSHGSSSEPDAKAAVKAEADGNQLEQEAIARIKNKGKDQRVDLLIKNPAGKGETLTAEVFTPGTNQKNRKESDPRGRETSLDADAVEEARAAAQRDQRELEWRQRLDKEVAEARKKIDERERERERKEKGEEGKGQGQEQGPQEGA